MEIHEGYPGKTQEIMDNDYVYWKKGDKLNYSCVSGAENKYFGSTTNGSVHITNILFVCLEDCGSCSEDEEGLENEDICGERHHSQITPCICNHCR